MAAALLSSWLLSGSPWFPREDVPFWMELPDYRLPPLGSCCGDWPGGGGLLRRRGPFAAGLGGGVVCRQLRLGAGRVW
ncbi:MAG: hypothetical protein ACLS82_07325 [Evtepia gabavorous]